MSTHKYEYQIVREKLMPQMRRCRDKGVRFKVELILLGLKLENITLACKRLGVGRASYHKWWKRLIEGKFKISSLEEKSRRPKRSPNKIDAFLEKRIRYYRRKGYGPDMIREYLVREGRRRVSASTINHVINKRLKNFIKPKSNKLKKHRRRYELVVPGQRLQMDVKYSPMKVGGQTVYIYVAVDESTRWRYMKAYPAVNEHWTIEFLKGLERGFPFPINGIQTDNGHEFTFKLFGNANCREHALEEWCRQKEIRLQRIPPGVKELNGKVERSHRIDADYFYGRAPTESLGKFNKALEVWMNHYNKERPHGGLGYMTPMEKLKERLVALNRQCFLGKEEPMRKRFIKSVKLIGDSNYKSKIAA